MAGRGMTLKWLSLLGAAAVLAALIYNLADALRGGPAERPQIAVLIKSTQTGMEFWGVLQDGVKEAAKEFDVEVNIVGPKRETDVDEQIALVEKTLAEKPDAVVLAATDFNLLAPYAERIDEAGIPLITVDSAVNSSAPRSYIATDNVEAGSKVGHKMAQLSGGGRSKVAIISYVRDTASQMEREQGVRDVLEADERFEILDTYYSGGDETKAYEITKSLIRQHPDLTGIVGLNEPSTVGAGRAIKDLEAVGRVTLVGFDSSVDEVRLLEEGVMRATVVQRPFNMGYLAVKTAVEALRGEKVPSRVDTGSVVVTKDNIYEEEHQKLLFPFIGRSGE